MSCGTPAIVFNSTACPELIRPGCGYVVERRNLGEIYKSICMVRSNGKAFYADHCIRNVRANFEINQNISKTIELYNNILSQC